MRGSGPAGQAGHGSLAPGGRDGWGDAGGEGSDGAATDRTAVSWSFVPTRSFDAVVTTAVFVSDPPAAPGRTVAAMRTRVVAPAARSSRVHRTVRPDAEQLPSSATGLPVTRSPFGSRSVTTTSLAVDGPALDTTRVKTTSSPTVASSVDPRFTMLRSASTTTRVVTVSALLASSGSRAEEVTEAVLVRAPVAPPATIALTVTVAVAPFAREATVQLTSPPVATGAQAPAEVVAAGSSRTPSSGSLTVTSVAVAGPALRMVRV